MWVRFVLLGILFALPAMPQRELAGSARTYLALKKLTVLGSVLLIGAHPDDENAALLAYLARGLGARTAYLSLTRGDGGQNLIGPEKGELLGVIRTQEMLAARRIDGAEQFFTRAVDFGFSKSAEETLQKWGREQVLADVVWVIRSFRPDVIVVGVTAGHGHHQAVGILAREAFRAAGDPSKFPEQLRYVRPWQAKRLISGGFGGPGRGLAGNGNLGSVRADFGEYNPVLGYSYSEIAGMSRSMHRTQGVGAPERRGTAVSILPVLDGEAASGGLFDGIETSWRRLPNGAKVAGILEEAERTFDPRVPEKTIPLLLKARPLIRAIQDPWAFLKLKELDEAVALCAGLFLDAAAEKHLVSPGESLAVNLEATNRSRFSLTLTGVRIEGEKGPMAESSESAVLSYNQPWRRTLTLRVPEDQPYSQPYWLRHRHDGFKYTIDDPLLVGAPENPPVFQAKFRVQAGDQVLEFARPVIYRYVSRTMGETTRPLVIGPPVSVDLTDPVILFPQAVAKVVDVKVRALVGPFNGVVRLEAPKGWKVEPEVAELALEATGQERTVRFRMTPPVGEAEGELRAVVSSGQREYANAVRVIEYADLPPQTVLQASTAKLVRSEIRTLARRIGYVMGAGDEVPRALEQLGCEVVLLDGERLARGDLSQFDAIVTGVRAFNVREDLLAHHGRLMEYVQNGGTLVVQYNTADARSALPWQRFAPYPIQLSSLRVTVEDAPVSFPNPNHPLLAKPNLIRPEDFQGWVQERGLYFPAQWDSRYDVLFESHDPGEAPLPGGTLVAKYGKGVYVYSSYAWFRQLPAGVPGAFRIFANLLSAGRTLP